MDWGRSGGASDTPAVGRGGGGVPREEPRFFLSARGGAVGAGGGVGGGA